VSVQFSDGLTAARLREVLAYNPLTGEFLTLRPVAKGQSIPPGSSPGSVTKAGYLRITIDGKQYLAHRLAWLYVRGEFPTCLLDHKNTVRLDNRIDNLRLADSVVNGQNRRAASSNSSHGWLGATYRPRQGWVSQIGVNGRQSVIGYFDEPEPAHLMYLIAKIELHPGSTL